VSNGDQPITGPGEPLLPAESDAKQIAKLATEGQVDSGWFYSLWRALGRSFTSILLDAIDLMVFVVDKFFFLIGKFFRRAQGEENPAFWELVAAITEDMLGIDVDAAALKASFFGSGRINAMEAVGGQVFDLLAQEFVTPPGEATPGKTSPKRSSGIGGLPAFTISPEQGVEAARRFMGFGMTFAVREANVGVLGELATIGFAKNFRDYGENMVANLAIGRLMRIALRPLLTVLIADPLTQALNKQYRPKALSEAQLLTLFHHDPTRQGEVLEQLALLGLSDHNIQALLEVEKVHVKADDIELLERYGELSHADAVKKLTASGLSADDAELQLHVIDLRRLDTLAREQAALYQTQFENGVLDADQLRLSLDALPITDDEKHTRQVLAATRVELPRKFPTIAEMTTALVEGVVTVEEYDQFLIREGFGSDDATILRLLALLKTARVEEARAAAADRLAAKAAKAAAKKKPPAPGGTPPATGP
jgi:hypothetical protein